MSLKYEPVSEPLHISVKQLFLKNTSRAARGLALPPPGGYQTRAFLQRFRGGLVFKDHRLLYHSSLGSRVMEKEKKRGVW